MLDSLRWQPGCLPGTAVPVWRLRPAASEPDISAPDDSETAASASGASWPDASSLAAPELALASSQAIGDWAAAQAFVLSRDERARAARLATASLTRRWEAAHVLLRWTIAAHLNASPGELSFTRTTAGKPVLGGPFTGSATFSLAHSGEWIVIAVMRGRHCEIGVDAELLVAPSTAVELGSAFTPAEQAELSRLRGSAFARAATRLWTRKEAYLKALGTGLLRDPSRDCIGTRPVPRIPAGAPAGTVIADLPILPGSSALAALCVTGRSAGS